MTTILSIIFWLAVVAGVVAFWAYLSGRHYRLELEPDAIHFVSTEDGWRLSMLRYRPNRPLPGAPPVVLCAGAGMSSAVFDVSRETSLVRYLTEHGYDTWLLDLRGRGFARRRGNWSFDDYVEFDIPAALRQVCSTTGASQVQWVGFGIGAMAMFGTLTGPEGQRVRSMVALAAPVFFKRQQAHFGPRLLRWLRRIRIDFLARLGAPLLGRFYPGPLSHLQNRDNVEGGVYRRALINNLASFGRTELLQYAEWLERDAFTAIVQRRDYRSSMGSISTPTLFIVGPRDELAPPDMVEATANLLEEVDDRPVVLASRMHGMSTNYGHLDLLVGKGVHRDIHTHVLRWLDLHAGVEIPQGRPEPPEPRETWRGDAVTPEPRLDPTPEQPVQVPPEAAPPAAAPEAAPTADGSAEGESKPVDEPEEDVDSEAEPVQGDVPRTTG